MSEIGEAELTQTAVKMLTHGSGYKAIRTYLKRNCDEETEDRIIQTVIQFEKDNQEVIYEKQLEISKGPKTSLGGKIFYKAMSALMFLGGGALSLFLWDRGRISGLTIALTVAGLYGLLKPKH